MRDFDRFDRHGGHQMYDGGMGMFHDHDFESMSDREQRLYGDEPFEDRPLPKLIDWGAIWRFFFPKKEGTPQ
jgi:hypothetical protein